MEEQNKIKKKKATIKVWVFKKTTGNPNKLTTLRHLLGYKTTAYEKQAQFHLK